MGNNYYFNIDYNQSIKLESDGNPIGDYDTIWIRQGKNCADKDESSASQKNNSCAKGSYYDSNAPKCDTFGSKNKCGWIKNKADTIYKYYDTHSSYSNVPVLIKEVCPAFPTPTPDPCPAETQCKTENAICVKSGSCPSGGCCDGFTCKAGADSATTVCVNVKDP